MFSTLAALVAGVTVGAAVAIWTVPSAAAAVDCSGGHYMTWASPANPHHGTRSAQMSYYNENPSSPCTHTSSLISIGADGDYVEVGWIDAALNEPISHDPHCNVLGTGSPLAFRAHWESGTFYCTGYGALDPNLATDSFAILDQDGNENWGFSMNGNWLGGTLSETFSLSSSVTNGERYGAGESAKASFNGLQYMPLNGSWTDWLITACKPSQTALDPTYSNQIHSATYVTVSPSSQSC